MKRKTIKKVINKKLNDWIDTITDFDLQEDIKKHVIVTGGSIASMLLGETVNDYDVYFDDIDITERVAKYYVSEFIHSHSGYSATSVQILDKENISGEEEKRVCIIVPSIGIAGENPDNEEDGDVLDPKDSPDTDDDKYKPVFLSENAITLSNKLQIIVRFCGNPEELHNNFDFVHAMNWYRMKDEELNLNPLALECLLSRTLIYKGSLYPICSIFRARKFIQRGWNINAGELLKIMWQISELDLTDISVLREQLTGVDALYFSNLIQAMEGLDKDKFNSTYAAEVIDRIFQ